MGSRARPGGRAQVEGLLQGDRAVDGGHGHAEAQRSQHQRAAGERAACEHPQIRHRVGGPPAVPDEPDQPDGPDGGAGHRRPGQEPPDGELDQGRHERGRPDDEPRRSGHVEAGARGPPVGRPCGQDQHDAGAADRDVDQETPLPADELGTQPAERRADGGEGLADAGVHGQCPGPGLVGELAQDDRPGGRHQQRGRCAGHRPPADQPVPDSFSGSPSVRVQADMWVWALTGCPCPRM